MESRVLPMETQQRFPRVPSAFPQATAHGAALRVHNLPTASGCAWKANSAFHRTLRPDGLRTRAGAIIGKDSELKNNSDVRVKQPTGERPGGTARANPAGAPSEKNQSA